MPFWRRNQASKGGDEAGTVAGRLADVEAGLRSLRVEWQDTVDRIERVLARLNKRAQRAEAAEPEPEPEVPAFRAPNGATDEVELRRRARVFPGRRG